VIPPFPKNEDLFYFKPDRIFYEIKKLAEY
jgi:hypothetical protein